MAKATIQRADEKTLSGGLVGVEEGSVLVDVARKAGMQRLVRIPLDDIVDMTLDASPNVLATLKPMAASATTKPSETQPSPASALGPPLKLELVNDKAERQIGFKRLFDGKTLTGWHGKPDTWHVEEGAIAGKTKKIGNGDSYLVWTGPEFENFELRFRYKADAGSAALVFRNRLLDPKGEKIGGYGVGFEANVTGTTAIEDEGKAMGGRDSLVRPFHKVVHTPSGDRKASALDVTPPPLKDVVRKTGWNDCNIIAAGSHIVVAINGLIYVDLVDENQYAFKSGGIALRLRGPQANIQFKDLRIRSFEAIESANARLAGYQVQVAKRVETKPGVEPVVINPKGKWEEVKWAAELEAEHFALDQTGGRASFKVEEPQHRRVWVQRFAEPIDWKKTPILALKYRAQNTKSDNRYAIWLDDGTGNATGGVEPVQSSDLVADGKEHEFRWDLRKKGKKGSPPQASLNYMAVGVYAGDGPATFELIELQLEPPNYKPRTGTPTAPTPPPAESWNVILAGGDKLIGFPESWDEKAVHLRRVSGTLDVPVRHLSEVWRGTSEQVRQAKAMNTPVGLEDIAFIEAQGGQIRPTPGLVQGIDGSTMKFRFNDQDRKIALDRLVGVVFGTADRALPSMALQQTFMLNGGEALSGTWTGVSKDALTLKTAWDATISVPINAIGQIKTRNGRLASLTELTPAAVEQVPYFDRIVSWRVDKSLAGGPLRLSDAEYPHGIAVHARTVLQYDIGGVYQQFKGRVGLQQPEGKQGRVLVRVSGDGKTLFEQQDLRGDMPPVDLDLNLTGVKRLTLEVDFGQGQDVGDHVVWANPRLLRSSIGKAAEHAASE